MNYLSAFALLLSMVFPGLTAAQAPAVSVQEQCYLDLKANMAETSIMGEQLAYITPLSYAQLESQFSKKYKTTSSLGVGISLDQAKFSTRLFFIR